jgi:hypothetical protein
MAATSLSIVTERAVRVPWYVWCATAAVTCSMVGVHWDISWHRSIGRDTFWTPAHIVIQVCGILAGISCGYLILATTFGGRSELRDSSVRIWGFRGPLGAFLAAWGGIAMITSAPFDNWWHDAYGLDVKIISPPHMLLATGILAVHLGALILILGHMNRAEGELKLRYQWMFLYVGGMILVCLMVLQMELTIRSAMHTAKFYRLVMLITPVVLAGIARASDLKWSAATVAGVYTTFVLLMGWILPLFPAQAKLGPVYTNVTQFIPSEFPLLVMVPAFALDLFWQRTADWGTWKQALVSGLVFLAIFAAVQWPFADFLMSPAARNWVFGTKYFGYYTRPTSLYATYQFFPVEKRTELWTEIAIALATAVVGMRFGLAWGDWMRRIRR